MWYLIFKYTIKTMITIRTSNKINIAKILSSYIPVFTIG